MEEKRRAPRWHLSLQLSVFDQYFLEHLEHIKNSCAKGIRLISNAPVGQISDISTTGLRLSSGTPIPKGEVISLALQVPVPGGGTDKIALSAKSVWCKSGAMTDYYENGFEFVNPESKAIFMIKSLIYFYKSNDSSNIWAS